jgi:protein-disulfide isomerase
MGPRVDLTLSVVLTVTAVSMAVVVVGREVRSSSRARSDSQPSFATPRPVYLPDWRTFRELGIELGDSGSPVQVLVFNDLECFACRRYHFETLRSIQEQARVSLTFLHLPLGTHRFAMDAARGAECAATQGAFKAFAEMVFLKQDSLGLKPWVEYAREARIADPEAVIACMQGEGSFPRIEAGLALAARLGVDATPTVIVNGWLHPRPPSLRELAGAVADVLRGVEPAGGSRRPDTVRGPGPALRSRSGLATGELSGAGAQPFVRVSGVHEFADGRVLVVDAHDFAVWLLDLDGPSMTRLGRQGGGPGEYRLPSRVFSLVDGDAAVWDEANGRMLIVGQDGVSGVLDRSGRPIGEQGADGGLPLLQATDLRGFRYARGSDVAADAGGGHRVLDSVPILRWDRTRRPDTVAFLPLPRARSGAVVGGLMVRPASETVPFESVAQWAVAHDGTLAIVFRLRKFRTFPCLLRVTPSPVVTPRPEAVAGSPRAGGPAPSPT